jgi:hypothetical protein
MIVTILMALESKVLKAVAKAKTAVKLKALNTVGQIPIGQEVENNGIFR